MYVELDALIRYRERQERPITQEAASCPYLRGITFLRYLLYPYLSSSSKEWKEAAKELDSYLQFDDWKKVDEDPLYDWKLVRRVRFSLPRCRMLLTFHRLSVHYGIFETRKMPGLVSASSRLAYDQISLPLNFPGLVLVQIPMHIL